MARHLAPFSWRQRMAASVRRRSFGCVLPLGRHASTNGSKLIHCASDTIALSSFQKEQNARHHKQFKREQALAEAAIPSIALDDESLEAEIRNSLDALEEAGFQHTLEARIALLRLKPAELEDLSIRIEAGFPSPPSARDG